MRYLLHYSIFLNEATETKSYMSEIQEQDQTYLVSGIYLFVCSFF